MTPPASRTGESLRQKRIIPATPDAVFQAWTDPARLMKWMAPSDAFSTPLAETDLKVGGRYRIRMKDPAGKDHTVVGVYKEIVAGRKLVFTWQWEEGDNTGDRSETLVTLEMEPKDGDTAFTLTHENFPNVGVRDHHNEGWTGCIERLDRFAQGRIK